MDTDTAQHASIASTLEEYEQQRGWLARRPWLKWAGLALLVAVLVIWFMNRGAGDAVRYITQEVTRGDITVTVTATGNLEPLNQVDIGSELSGTVRSVAVDVNDEVKAGQVLAVLDTTRLQAQVLQARSSLASAQARVLQSEASAKEARANFARLQRVRELSGGKLPSEQELDVADAAVARADGETAAARAAVAQAEANLEAVLTDLSKAQIRSPINGVVLVRSVEPGQTVAASLQAPVLFTLAEDLKKMELHVSVDEADVGAVQVGQAATFTVDAFPNRSFEARITQVHFASNNTQKSTSSTSAASATSTGVVTYETVLEVENEELLLRPGMTATAEIVTTNIEDALVVPNAALRFTPENVELPGAKAAPQRSPLTALMPRMPRRSSGAQGGDKRLARVWILIDAQPTLTMFRPGVSDGRVTQVLDADATALSGARADDPQLRAALERKLEVGMAVIVDAEAPSS